jgi:hypothetical protein
LPIQKCLPQGPAWAEEFNPEQLFNRSPAQLLGSSWTQNLIEEMRRVQDGEGRIEADEGSPD